MIFLLKDDFQHVKAKRKLDFLRNNFEYHVLFELCNVYQKRGVVLAFVQHFVLMVLFLMCKSNKVYFVNLTKIKHSANICLHTVNVLFVS